MKLNHLFLSFFLFSISINSYAEIKWGNSGTGDVNVRGLVQGNYFSSAAPYDKSQPYFPYKMVTSCANAVSIYNAYDAEAKKKVAETLNLPYADYPPFVYSGSYYAFKSFHDGEYYISCNVTGGNGQKVIQISKVRDPSTEQGKCPKGLNGSMLFNESPNKGYSCLGADARSKVDGRLLHGCQVQFDEVLTLKTPIDGNRYQGDYSTTGATCSSGIPQGSENPKEKEPKQPTPPKDPPKDNPKEPDCPAGHNSGTVNGKLVCVPKVPDAPNTPPSDDNSNPDDKKDDTKPDPKDDTTPPSDNNQNNNPNSGSNSSGGSSSGNSNSNSSGGSSSGSPNGADNGSINGGMSGDNTGSSGTGTDGTGEKDGNGKDDKDGDGILDFLKDLFKDDVDSHIPRDTQLEFPTPDLQKPNTNIHRGGYCPAPLFVPYNFAGVSGRMEFTFEYFCRICEFLRPVVIAVATFLSALIVSGVTTRSNS